MIASKLWVSEWARVGDVHGVNFDVRLTDINQFGSHLLFSDFLPDFARKIQSRLEFYFKIYRERSLDSQ